MRSKLVEKIIETDNTDLGAVVGGGRIYSFLNPVSYIDALKHQELFCQMDGLFADGAILVAAIRLLYGVKLRRYSFDMTSLAPKILKDAVRHKRSIYVVGAKQDQLEWALATLQERYKGINIIGHRNGYFGSEMEEDEEACHIAAMNPDLLIVGMGAVVQEKFLLKVKEAGFMGVGFSCGGFIHQASKNFLDYYPAWIDKMNLRFLYRMWKEPHTRMRYVKAGLVFPLKFIKELIPS